MSIRSRTPGIASDVPTMERQRAPNYMMKQRNPIHPGNKVNKRHVNNISDYVSENLKKTVKPRHSENR
jgi:hypothetical protein